MPCVACGSLRGWQVCCGISGKFAVECAATLLWNQWQVLRGIGGNFRMEQGATFVWNRGQLSRGIRSRALDAPDGDPTQPDTRIMRMACQAPSPATGRLVL